MTNTGEVHRSLLTFFLKTSPAHDYFNYFNLQPATCSFFMNLLAFTSTFNLPSLHLLPPISHQSSPYTAVIDESNSVGLFSSLRCFTLFAICSNSYLTCSLGPRQSEHHASNECNKSIVLNYSTDTSSQCLLLLEAEPLVHLVQRVRRLELL